MIRWSKLNEMFHSMNTNEVLLDVSVSPEKNMKNKKYHTVGAFPTATNTNSSVLIIQNEILVWFAKS